MLLVSAVSLLLNAAPSPQQSWAITSSNGGATIAQAASAADACVVRCTVAGKELWSKPVCLGRSTDFIFVSEDCAAALVLSEYPQRLEPVALTPVASSVSGGEVRTFRLREVMDEAATRGEGKRVRWLQGVVGEPGVRPHLNPKGDGIELTTLDGVSHAVRFSTPDDLAPARAAPAPVASNNTEVMYQFVDAEGSTQFVMGLSQVPRRFQKSATPVDAQINTVAHVKMPPRPPSFATSRPVTSRPAAPPPAQLAPPGDSSGCHIYGLQGSACSAVQNSMNRHAQPLEVRLPPAEPPRPPPSPYR